MSRRSGNPNEMLTLGGIEIPTAAFQLPALTLDQAVTALSHAIALPSEDATQYRPQALKVLHTLHRLKGVGRQNLMSPLTPASGITFDDILQLLEAAGIEYVYVAANAAGQHKIGRSNDPPVRIRNLSTGAAGRVTRVLSLRCPKGFASKVEAAAHKQLGPQRLVSGEWFQCTEAEAKHTAETAWQAVYGRAPEDADRS